MANLFEDGILAQARSILLDRMRQPGGIINSVESVHQYVLAEYGLLENEEFGCMFLDQTYRLINHKKMFRGTVSACAVYPQTVVREALLQNATFVILVHNHPAQSAEASPEDISSTKQIQQMLSLLDIVLFDHIVVAGPRVFSMRSEGLLT